MSHPQPFYEPLPWNSPLKWETPARNTHIAFDAQMPAPKMSPIPVNDSLLEMAENLSQEVRGDMSNTVSHLHEKRTAKLNEYVVICLTFPSLYRHTGRVSGTDMSPTNHLLLLALVSCKN
jgi:hypothetical protein